METLTKEIAIKLGKERAKIELHATRQIDWFNAEIKGKFKVFFDERDGCVWFFRPRATRKGFIFETLDNITYKII